VTLRAICVYCGSSTGHNPCHREAAAELGRSAARREITLVYGGGHVGLMGVLADAALGAGGRVIGVIPQSLVDLELAHRGLTELRIVTTMHQRKALMADLAEAFIALPGGIGTLEELFETWSWGQLGIHAKPCGLLNVDGYFAPLLSFLDAAVRQGFVQPVHRAMIQIGGETESLIDRLAGYHPPHVAKILRPEQI
jgi:hypothetical protein